MSTGLTWEEATPIFIILGLVLVGVFVVAFWSDARSRKRARENGGVDPVRQAARDAVRNGIEEARARSREVKIERHAALQKERDDKTPARTRLLTDQSTYTSKGSLTSAAGRAVVGNLVAGPIGAMVGAGTAKRTTQEQKSQVFKVWYKSGREGIETAAVGSARWKELIEKLEE